MLSGNRECGVRFYIWQASSEEIFELLCSHPSVGTQCRTLLPTFNLAIPLCKWNKAPCFWFSRPSVVHCIYNVDSAGVMSKPTQEIVHGNKKGASSSATLLFTLIGLTATCVHSQLRPQMAALLLCTDKRLQHHFASIFALCTTCALNSH